MSGAVHLRDGNGCAIEMESLPIRCDLKVGLFDSDGEVAIFGDFDETVILGLVVELLKGTDESSIYYGGYWLGWFGFSLGGGWLRCWAFLPFDQLNCLLVVVGDLLLIIPPFNRVIMHRPFSLAIPLETPWLLLTLFRLILYIFLFFLLQLEYYWFWLIRLSFGY